MMGRRMARDQRSQGYKVTPRMVQNTTSLLKNKNANHMSMAGRAGAVRGYTGLASRAPGSISSGKMSGEIYPGRDSLGRFAKQ